MTKDLGQADQIARIGFQVLVGKRVTEQVRMQHLTNHECVLIAERSDSSFAKWTTFANKNSLTLYWRSNFQVRRNRPSGGNR